MTAKTTTVTINGSRTDLVIGLRYRVRYGREDRIIWNGELVERARNGDLIFLEHGDPGAFTAKRTPERLRVRAQSIDSIFGSGVEELYTGYGEAPAREADEPAAAYLARVETALGARYTAWVETEAGQSLLEAIRTEERVGRTAARRKAPVQTVVDGTVVAESRHVDAPKPRRYPRRGELAHLAPRPAKAPPKLTRRGRAKIEEALGQRVPDVESLEEAAAAGLVALTGDAPKRTRADLRYEPRDPETGLLLGTHELPAGLNPNPAYTDHHFIWKCPSCKRRTRAAFCADGHASIPAPVGYRHQDRKPGHGRTEA